MDLTQTTPVADQGTGNDPRRWKALALLCTANFLVILDSQIVLLALPSIGQDLGLSVASTQWILTANLITFGGLLLLGGRAGDLLGRRRVFMVGTVLFLLTSLLSGLAWNGTVMVGARAVHGISAAMMAPAALAILSTTFREGAERNRALAVWAGTGGLGATVGLLLGGVLTNSLGWQWIFFVNVPVTFVLLLLSPMMLRESHERGQRRSFDVGGALTVTAALVLLVYAIVDAPAAGWGSTRTIGLFAAAAVLVVLFVIIEARSAAPLLPLRMLGSRTLVGGNLTMVMFAMLAFSMSFISSLYAQQVLGYSALLFGTAQSVMPIMAAVGAYLGQAVMNRRGLRPVIVTSMIFMGGGCLLLSRVPVDGSYVRDILPALVVFGLGLGAGTVGAYAAALGGVGAHDSGLASGLNTASFQIGGALGIAVVTTVMVSSTHGPTPVDLAGGFRAGFIACVVFGVVGLFFALAFIGRMRPDQPARLTERGAVR